MMPDADLQRMADDIKENGLNDDIITHQGKILDGRNRFKACEIAGIEPRFNEYDGDDALAFVISHNLHRRHLSESQRALVGAKWAKLKHGGDRKSNEIKSPIGDLKQQSATATRDKAGKILSVGTSSIDRAKKVIKEAPQLVPKIESGEMTVNKAYESIRQKPAPAPEPEPVIVDEVTPAMPKRLPNWVPDDAERLWTLARQDLNKILKNDKSRVRVLNDVIEYARKRLEENK